MSSIIVVPDVPVGDPAGMQELADALKSAASSLGSIAGDVSGLPGGMVFEGPAGDRFRGRMQTDGSSLTDAAHRLSDDATRLAGAIADVERQLAARAAAIQKLHEQAPNAVLKELP
jgi:hypothetical protein